MFGIGLDTYWPRFFLGEKECLEGDLDRVGKTLGWLGVGVFNIGLVDSPGRAYEAAWEFRRGDVDVIFLHVTT